MEKVELLVTDIHGVFTVFDRYDFIKQSVDPVINYCSVNDRMKSEDEIKSKIEDSLFEKYSKCQNNFDTIFVYHQMRFNVEKARVNIIYDSSLLPEKFSIMALSAVEPVLGFHKKNSGTAPWAKSFPFN